MRLHPADIALVILYLLAVVATGLVIRRRATGRPEAYYLAGRGVPWWILGLSGCSSYIDIGGTMAMVGLLFYVGLQGIWATHIVWGWFMICFYMAFQARWIRRSGVMTFAEWNRTRFGDGGDAEAARLAAAVFLLILMVCNLMYIAVGIGKFAEAILPLEEWGWSRWQPTVIVFATVGVYVTLGGFLGVILTDVVQTVLIAAGAVILSVLAFATTDVPGILAARPDGWAQLTPSWTLWSGYLEATPPGYHHFYYSGPLILAASSWALFRVLAGPNVWDFQFFLTARSARDAALAGGVWTVGYTLRWILGCAFLVLAFPLLGEQVSADAEQIMPRVLGELPIGVCGLFVAVLLAALMSTLDAMVNVTSSVVVNDLLRRYAWRGLTDRRAVQLGQAASLLALLIGLIFSLSFRDVVSAWETMIFVVVTMILVPATLRWHWWRFGARAFVASMVATAGIVLLLKIVVASEDFPFVGLPASIGASLVASLILGRICSPTRRDVLVAFYARIRPFGFWGPIRREAIDRGLVPPDDRTPAIDLANGVLTMLFQLSLAVVPFLAFLRRWRDAGLWALIALALGAILYFTWYRTLPARDET